jgi:HAD superfamily hydrolase (TIGR01450 family)
MVDRYTVLRAVQAFVFDVDGTLVLADDPNAGGGISPLPGAGDVLRALAESARPFVCFTNGSGQVPAAQAARLRAVGLPVTDEQMLTPANVAAAYVQRHHPGMAVLAFGNEGLLQPLRAADVPLADLASAEQAGVVLVGADPEFTDPKLVAACRAVWAGAALLVTSMAPYFASRGGPLPSTSGAIAAGITHVTGVEPVVLGKPSAVCMQVLAEMLGVPASEIAVIGDDVHLEIRMGREAGARTVLVLSGSTVESEADADLVLANVGEMLALL